MGNKYKRYLATGKGVTVDSRYAFEVTSGKIITYGIKRKGFMWLKTSYTQGPSQPITKETTVKVWGRIGASGNCDVRTGNKLVCYCIFGQLDGFAADIEAEINRAPS